MILRSKKQRLRWERRERSVDLFVVVQFSLTVLKKANTHP